MRMISELAAMFRGDTIDATDDGIDALGGQGDPYLAGILQGHSGADPNRDALGEHGCAVDIIRGQAG